MTSSAIHPSRSQPYVGRFAPSPSGPLHLGSMLAALAAWLDARAHGGCWLLRMEDLDTPRVQPGAADIICRQLEAFHLHWDGEILWQSRRTEAYREALFTLESRGMLFNCQCSRKALREADSAESGEPRYPGTCRSLSLPSSATNAIRVRVSDEPITVNDRILPSISSHLQREIGDFVLKRRDGIIAYQLAVVVDDQHQGITHVVRGADIHSSTARQIWLQHQLNASTPIYAHTPLLCDPQARKLSKQNHAPAVSLQDPGATTVYLLQQLNHSPPDDLRKASVTELLDWAVAHWEIERLRNYTPLTVGDAESTG